MSRIIAWRHQGGGAHGHIFVWASLGAALSTGTGQHHPWRLYHRFAGVHGHLFVWDRGRTGGAPAPSGGGDIYVPILRRRRR
jgi:hypothetical protein